METPKTAYLLSEYSTFLRQRRIFGQFYLQFETPILRAAMYLMIHSHSVAPLSHLRRVSPCFGMFRGVSNHV